MKKEIIIIISILIVVIVLNLITQNYTKHSINLLNDKLKEIKSEIEKENIENNNIQNRINETYELWQKKEKILAYYIEHDELEKIGSKLNLIRGDIQSENYDEAVSNIEETVFIFNHIEEKYKVLVKNIF